MDPNEELNFQMGEELEERMLELQEEINDLDRMEQFETLALKDVLTDLDTPAHSDSEDDEPLCGQNATDIARVAAMTPAQREEAQNLMVQMEASNLEPNPLADLARVYRSREYRRRAQRKTNMLKRFLEDANFLDSYSDDGFMKEVRRLREVYPEEERQGLVELVAFYNHQREKYLFFFGSSESEPNATDEEETRN